MVNNNFLNSNGGGVVKFLCSYGGKILPRKTDGKLRYVGGETRVISVDRSITFTELLMKLGELCGSSVSLRCQFPMEDLDALVSITCDEDLANLIEEYDRANQESKQHSLKIRAFLSPPKSIKKISPPSSITSSPTSSVSRSCNYIPRTTSAFPDRCFHQIAKPASFPVYFEKSTGPVVRQYAPCLPPRHPNHHHHHIYSANHWQ
ncbi:hypothetical protein AQUCO_09400022v1 [Aquilegia coerulea]|uniref:PB1 domain-containing protein n=1 Tax=Aquilegia coerulea TaxID=218851 RepID=A0A2G5C6D8_AQUCA|nr:hypothetical protein AQUCO_09400022v1 [Aquilegia coerulea]